MPLEAGHLPIAQGEDGGARDLIDRDAAALARAAEDLLNDDPVAGVVKVLSNDAELIEGTEPLGPGAAHRLDSPVHVGVRAGDRELDVRVRPVHR